MAIIDQLIELATDQTVTADAASEDTVDTQATGDIGVGTELFFVVTATADLVGNDGDETYAVKLQQADDTAFAGNDLEDVATATFSRSDKKGTEHVIRLPYGVTKRHLRAWFDVGGTTPSGKFNARLTCEPPQKWTAYTAVI